VLTAYHERRIELEAIPEKTRSSYIENTSHVLAREDTSWRPFTIKQLAEFIHWPDPERRIKVALAGIKLINDGLLRIEQLNGISTRQAEANRRAGGWNTRQFQQGKSRVFVIRFAPLAEEALRRCGG
jgi:hypothetical protein